MPAADILQRFRTNELARFLNSHRIFFYTLISLVSVSAVIVNALKDYSNFYSVAIYLSKSSRSVLVLANFGVLLALLCGHIVQRIFFGSLRPNEVERLYDRLWFFITESLLAFTIFRDEFDTPFALMFGFLLFVKSFHWLASDRIEWMDQRPYPGPPLSFHFRMAMLFVILWATDCLVFLFAVEHTLNTGVGGMVLFASEYGILMASVMNTIVKYLLSAYDLRRAGRRGGENAPPWENKSMWIFYIELATDFLKLTTYLIFFIIIITFYGLPLNILRDVYITARSFVTRLRALHRYQTATRNMDQRYPNATEAELSEMSDRTCIICREEMISNTAHGSSTQVEGPNTTPKKLPCGHVFHFHCLRSWLERQQSCPTCRRNVLEAAPTPAPGTPGQAPNAPAQGQQQNNNIAPANDQNVPAGNNNNPLGLIGRLFGPQPGLADPMQNRQQNQVQAGVQVPAAGGAQQAGVSSNYQPQQPQELPPYPGFAGPGGVWQPWPVAQGANHNDAAPSPTDHMESRPDSPSTLPQSPLERSDSLSAREAAAQAALRRFGVQPPGDTRPNEPTLTQSSSKSSTTSPSTTQIQAPHLIPLYDFRPQPTPTSIPLPGNQFGAYSPFNSPTQPPRQPTFGQFTSNPRNTRTLPRQLPPTLTDEQLARLDTLTRDSIDERLRVLEGVSNSVYRCMDDLLTLRSALPASGPSTVHARSTADSSHDPMVPSPENEQNEQNASSSRQKEKQKAVPLTQETSIVDSPEE